MADPRLLQIDELVNRPGTYFNPTTEILLVVDDSPHLDTEILAKNSYEADDWILISDEVPIEEHERDALLERFQIGHEAGTDDDEEENDVLEPDPDPDEE
ncbi:MAG: hypothetical protein QOF83_2328 [Solirubrobacteraceae bacterium]|jgi:hypothetical protein|nr:hypothetical protein [Solirubrobacteraceae bacterium]